MITGLIPALSCRNYRPHAPFGELVKLSPGRAEDKMWEEQQRRVLGERK